MAWLGVMTFMGCGSHASPPPKPTSAPAIETHSLAGRNLRALDSITKPLTTVMEAVLVDQGKLRWDTPLTTLLPEFGVDDADRTRQLVLWHASCACSGLGSPDVEGLFESAGVTPEDRITAMRRMKPTAPLGAKYQYSNQMVGEWKSTFGRRVEKDGSVKLVLVDPPLAGGALGVRDASLIVETSSGDLALQRASAGERP